MAAAFAIDLGLVLYIELTRHAVEKVGGGVPTIVIVHASISTVVILLYVAMLALGWNLFQARSAPAPFPTQHRYRFRRLPTRELQHEPLGDPLGRPLRRSRGRGRRSRTGGHPPRAR